MTKGVLEAMAAFGGQSIALIENLQSAAERIGVIVAQTQAAIAGLTGSPRGCEGESL